MLRLVLIHEGVRIPLTSGETLIGRALHCRLRFNDPSVSREHLRVVVSDAGATVENLSRTKGSMINDRPLVGVHSLRDGDTLHLGFRRLVVLLEQLHASPTSEDVGLSGDSIPVDQDALVEDVTRPEGAPVMLPGGIPAAALGLPLSLNGDARDNDLKRSAEALATSGRACADSSAVVEGSLHRPRRAHERFAIELPVVYRSAALIIDCETRNISVGGVFIASELLDPIGTRCALTLRPEGDSTVDFDGVVVRVQAGGAPAQVPGMGVQFTSTPTGVERWLRRASGAVR